MNLGKTADIMRKAKEWCIANPRKHLTITTTDNFIHMSFDPGSKVLIYHSVQRRDNPPSLTYLPSLNVD